MHPYAHNNKAPSALIAARTGPDLLLVMRLTPLLRTADEDLLRRIEAECRMKRSDNILQRLGIDYARYLDLRRRHHLDADAELADRLEHRCGDARIADHARADDRHLHESDLGRRFTIRHAAAN